MSGPADPRQPYSETAALTPANVARTYATRWFACHDMSANLPACDHCGEPGVPAVGPLAPARSWTADAVGSDDTDDLGDEEA